MSTPYLSIIIPAHNEEKRLPNTLEQIFSYLNIQPYSAEVLVVENGSTDKTLEIAQKFAERYENLLVLHDERPGKGNAIRRGMLEAQGRYRFMCDADLSMPIDELAKFVPEDGTDIQIAIASREADGAVRYDEPEYRHLGGRLVNLAIRTLILPGLHDTQCGFKCFNADVAKDVFTYQSLPGWSFDIEILFIARKRGYQVAEVPINWYFDPETKLRAGKDALRMIRDIFKIHWNNFRRRYDSKT